MSAGRGDVADSLRGTISRLTNVQCRANDSAVDLGTAKRQRGGRQKDAVRDAEWINVVERRLVDSDDFRRAVSSSSQRDMRLPEANGVEGGLESCIK